MNRCGLMIPTTVNYDQRSQRPADYWLSKSYAEIQEIRQVFIPQVQEMLAPYERYASDSG